VPFGGFSLGQGVESGELGVDGCGIHFQEVVQFTAWAQNLEVPALNSHPTTLNCLSGLSRFVRLPGSLGSLWPFGGSGGWGGGEVFFRVGVEFFDAGFAAQFDDLAFVGHADRGAIVTAKGISGDDAFGGVCRETAASEEQDGSGEQAQTS
jgi:hypothetical protein